MKTRTLIISAIPVTAGAVIGSAKWGWVGGLCGTLAGLIVGVSVAKLTDRRVTPAPTCTPYPPAPEPSPAFVEDDPDINAMGERPGEEGEGNEAYCNAAPDPAIPTMQDMVAGATWAQSDLFPTRPPLC